jgi:hypothetical protein
MRQSINQSILYLVLWVAQVVRTQTNYSFARRGGCAIAIVALVTINEDQKKKKKSLSEVYPNPNPVYHHPSSVEKRLRCRETFCIPREVLPD